MTTIKAFNKARNTTYVYESDSHWDKDKQQSRSKRKLIGKIDPKTGNVIMSCCSHNRNFQRTHNRNTIARINGTAAFSDRNNHEHQDNRMKRNKIIVNAEFDAKILKQTFTRESIAIAYFSGLLYVYPTYLQYCYIPCQ